MQILIVEDEIRLAKALKQILEEQKYMVDMVHTGSDGLEYGLSEIYDIIILDVMLPNMNGFDIAKNLRLNKIQTPIIMLTAKDLIEDKVKGLDYGADDYMTKPFAPQELLARIRVLSRRQGEVILDEMTFGDITFSQSSSELICKLKTIRLNYKEAELIKLFISNPTKIFSKADLIAKVWGYDSDVEDNTVEAYISFLRKKLTFVKSNTEIISIKKVGYKMKYE